jgi:hypothetical protein
MEFRQLHDFPDYKIYANGKVVRKERTGKTGKLIKEHELKATQAKNGYTTVTLRGKDGHYVQFYTHRLVYEAFYGEIGELEIDHVNGFRNGTDANGMEANNIQNLRAVTHKQNCANAVSKERYLRANAIDKGKYNKDRLRTARTREYYQKLIATYKELKEMHGKVGIWMLMKVGHTGYGRAVRICKELEAKDGETNDT